jgi:hypothetical protein
MTLDVYGGLFEDDLERLADRMDTNFGPDADQMRTKGAQILRIPRVSGG